MRPLPAALAVAGALALAACGEKEEPDLADLQPPEPAVDLSEARAFDEFDLYWAGKEAAGFPLTDAERNPGPKTWSFFYGDCEPPPGGDGGCAPPLEIQNWEICSRPPPREVGGLRRDPDLGEARIGEQPFTVYTGGTTVVLFGHATQAAERLRSLDGRTGGDELPAPEISGCPQGQRGD